MSDGQIYAVDRWMNEAKFRSAKKRYLIQIETNQRKWRPLAGHFPFV